MKIIMIILNFYLKFPNLNKTKDDKKQNYTYTIEKE